MAMQSHEFYSLSMNSGNSNGDSGQATLAMDTIHLSRLGGTTPNQLRELAGKTADCSP